MPIASEARAAVGVARAAPARRVLAALAALLLLVVGVLAADLTRKPHEQTTAAVLRAGLQLHRHTLGRWLPVLGLECRFTPTCSHYAEAALAARGTLGGSALTVTRLLRCGPWTLAGTIDPPPVGETP